MMISYNFERTNVNFAIFLAARIVVGLFLIRTVHKTDEYFQGPEVAHHIVYGYGELSWEWIFRDPIRNPLFPLIYSIGYYFLRAIGLSSYTVLSSITPKLIQAVIGASFDTILVQLNRQFNPKSTTKLLVFINFTNWVTLTYFSRTYVNSLQATLTTLAFYYWLLGREQTSRGYQPVGVQSQLPDKQIQEQPIQFSMSQQTRYDTVSRLLVIITFAIRGTSILYWVVVWPYELIRYHSENAKQALSFILKNILTLVLMVSLSVTVSVLWYRRLIWVEYNFFYYNVLKGWSSLCGTQPVIQYIIIYQYKIFSVGVVFIIYGLYKALLDRQKGKRAHDTDGRLRQLIVITVLSMLVLTFSSHKQLRFMLLLVPAQMIILVRGYWLFPYKRLRSVILFASIAISGYFFITRNILIKRGGLRIVQYIRTHPQITQVLFHMESYELPMYSYVHRNISLIIPEASFQTAIQNRSQLMFSQQHPQEYLQRMKKRLGHYPQFLITTSEYIDSKKLVLDGHWKQIMDEWYPSPMPEHYHRRIHLFQYVE